MSPIFELVNHPMSYRLGWVLLHSLWQGALVGVVFGLCRFALRKRSSNARYLAGCIALALLIAIPMLTFFSQSVTRVHNESSSKVLQTGGELRFTLADAVGQSNSDLGIGTETFVRLGAGWLWHAAPWIVGVWLTGVVIFSIRLMRGCWWVRTIRTTDNEPVDTKLLSLLNDLRRRLGISRPVRLLKSALVEVPTVVGWLQPIILMPAATLTGLTLQQLEAILAHELAHVRRFDYVVNVFQCLVETLMFYHPVAWWISRVVREEREHCCDDLVIKVCGNRLAYARALATLEAFRGELPQFAFAASGGSLTHRIRRLFGLSVDDKQTDRARLGGLALLGVGLVLVVLGGYLMLAPKTYQAEARIKVERNQTSSGSNEARNPTHPNDPYFVATEIEVIESSVVLSQVVDALRLDEVWGQRYNAAVKLATPEAVAMLRQRVCIQPVRNADLISIQVFDDDPSEAAQIANQIAKAYHDYRSEAAHELMMGSIMALKKQYDEQEAKTRQEQEAVDKLRKELGISDEDAARSDGPAPSIDAETLRRIETLRVETASQLYAEQKLIDQLKPLSRDELLQVLPTAMPDALFASRMDQRNNTLLQLAEMAGTYGKDSPDYSKAELLLKTLNEKIDERAHGIMVALETKVKIQEAEIKSLSAIVEEAKATDISQAERFRPYYDKKRELKSLMQLRSQLQLNLASAHIDADLPKTLVTIVDKAVPPVRPSSPNRALASALIVFGLLLDIVGLVTMVAGRRSSSIQSG